MDFLNLTTDSEEQQNQNYQNPDHEQPVDGEVLKNTHEEQARVDIGTNLTHEVDELKSSSIETAFQDFNYWKPQVDHNLDELLNQMNAN